ncbi:MAG: DUF5335 family protein [Rhodospirillales bacterium]|nr:DUF5335 family protein [Rhodospirillales bacterium]
MSTRQLNKNEWSAYFDHVSATLGNRQVEIEVASLPLGDQIAAHSVTLRGLTYDSKSDVLQVITDKVDHMVNKPKEIHVKESHDGLESFEVLDADGTKQIIQLTAPLALPKKAG